MSLPSKTWPVKINSISRPIQILDLDLRCSVLCFSFLVFLFNFFIKVTHLIWKHLFLVTSFKDTFRTLTKWLFFFSNYIGIIKLALLDQEALWCSSCMKVKINTQTLKTSSIKCRRIYLWPWVRGGFLMKRYIDSTTLASNFTIPSKLKDVHTIQPKNPTLLLYMN